MSNKIEIINNQKKIAVSAGLRNVVRKTCNTVLKCEKCDFDAQITVTFVDDERIKELNTQFRNIERSTDVLSFPLGENGEYDTDPSTNKKMLGDVVISLEHAQMQSEEYGHSFNREVAYLTAHSVLHLLGYDHVNSEEERKEMRCHEERVMEKMGLVR